MGWLRRRRADDEATDAAYDDGTRRGGYSESMTDSMRRLENYSYEFDENEAAEVEARIRRMFYGAKVEDD
jgi:hypothetical protein